MRRVLGVATLLALATLLVAVPPAAAAPDRAARDGQAARIDFNGDGGLVPSPTILVQGSGGVGGSVDENDGFGSSLAAGDYDGDGFFDLAVGAPLEDVGTRPDAGAVTVFNASGGGALTPDPPYTQGSGGLGGTAESLDLFGIALE